MLKILNISADHVCFKQIMKFCWLDKDDLLISKNVAQLKSFLGSISLYHYGKLNMQIQRSLIHNGTLKNCYLIR